MIDRVYILNLTAIGSFRFMFMNAIAYHNWINHAWKVAIIQSPRSDLLFGLGFSSDRNSIAAKAEKRPCFEAWCKGILWSRMHSVNRCAAEIEDITHLTLRCVIQPPDRFPFGQARVTDAALEAWRLKHVCNFKNMILSIYNTGKDGRHMGSKFEWLQDCYGMLLMSQTR